MFLQRWKQRSTLTVYRWIFFTGLLLLYASTTWSTPDVMIERLRSDYAAMVSAETDFHARRQSGRLIGSEAADYAGYVAGLHRRVAEDCVALEELGVTIPEGIPCPRLSSQFIAPVSINQKVERTSTEITSKLDAELYSALGDFDEVLLREQQRVKTAAPRSNTGLSASAVNESGEYQGTEQEGSDTGATATTDQDGKPTTGQGAGPGSPQQRRSKVSSRTPVDSDDDVVARQLREAAEKETDPELKKKLWEEYRKYKAGTS